MGFNPTFYAGRPKLSEVTIDSDLNMGGRDISGVDTLRASGSEVTIDSDLNMGGRDISGVDTLRAGRVDSPYMPETWPTEELEWGDIPAGDPVSFGGVKLTPINTWITLKTFEAPPENSYRWEFKIVTFTSVSSADFRIVADGVEVHNVSGHKAGTLTFDRVIPAGSTVEVQGNNRQPYIYMVTDESTVQNLGIRGGAKTFDLSGKWLALGLDMQGLAATVKIQGVSMPYSDYAKYFPLAPTELTIPGGWDASQIRPTVEVYL